MLQKISNLFYRWATGWKVFMFLVLDGFFAGFLMPLISGLMQGGQGGILALDLMLFSHPTRVFTMIEAYGESNRVFYRNVELSIDIFYPIIYLFAFGLLISWLFERGLAVSSSLRQWNILPLGAFIFDLLENTTIVALLSMYPSQPALLGWILFIFTNTKWLFAFASIMLMLVGFAMALRNRFKPQQISTRGRSNSKGF